MALWEMELLYPLCPHLQYNVLNCEKWHNKEDESQENLVNNIFSVLILLSVLILIMSLLLEFKTWN